MPACRDPHQPGRPLRAAADAEHPAVPARGQGVLVEDLDLQARGQRRLLGPAGELGRRQVVGRGVDQVAGEGDGRGDDAGPAADRVQALLLRVGDQHGHQLRRGRAGPVAGPVRPERVRPQQRALGGRGRQLHHRALAAAEPERARDLGLAGQRPGRGAGRAGDLLGRRGRAVRGGRAEADRDHQRDRRGRGGRDLDQVVVVAGGADRGQRVEQPAVEGGVGDLGAGRQPYAVGRGDGADDQRVGVQTGEVRQGEGQLDHGAPSDQEGAGGARPAGAAPAPMLCRGPSPRSPRPPPDGPWDTARHDDGPAALPPARPARRPRGQARRLRRLGDADRVRRRRRSPARARGRPGGRGRVRRLPPRQGPAARPGRGRPRERDAEQRPGPDRARAGAVHAVLRRRRRRRGRRPHRVPVRARARVPGAERGQHGRGRAPARRRGPGRGGRDRRAPRLRRAGRTGTALGRAARPARAAVRARLHELHRLRVGRRRAGRLPHRLHRRARVRAAAAGGAGRRALGRAAGRGPGARGDALRPGRPGHAADRDGLPAARAGPVPGHHPGAGPAPAGPSAGRSRRSGAGTRWSRRRSAARPGCSGASRPWGAASRARTSRCSPARTGSARSPAGRSRRR